MYLTGYRTLPTIGWLFLLQVIAAFGLGAIVLLTGGRLVSALGAGFALSTLAGYLLSLWVGLFGFREVRTAAGVVAAVVEIGAFAALATIALGSSEPRRSAGPDPDRTHLAGRLQAGIPGARWLVATCSFLAALVLAISLAVSGPSSMNTGSTRALLKLTKIHGVAVVTDARGYTLYRFVPDTPTRSTCYGTCAVYWPPVTGSPVAGPGVNGKVGVITRSDGQLQATYDGHPLYTYVGDAAPGQANGNDINLNGGLWFEMKASN